MAATAAARGGRAPARPATVPAWAELVRSGAGHAVSATVTGLLVVAGAVLVGWATATDPLSSAGGAARVAAAVWILAHLVDVSLGVPAEQGGTGPLPVSLTPLGFAAAVLALHARSGWRLARLARVWRGGAAAVAAAVATGAVVSGVLALAVASWAAGPGVGVDRLAAGAVVTVVAAAAMTVGVAAHSWEPVLGRLPGIIARPVRRWGTAGAVAAVTWVALAAVAAAGLQVTRLADIADRTAAAGTGPVGGVFLLAVQVALVPSVVVWTGAVLAGPGVSVGAAGVDLTGSAVADVPPLPLFAMAGPAGPYPVWAWAGVLLVVAAGGVAAWSVHRRRATAASSVTDRVADAVAVGVVAGASAGALGWASGGSVAAWGPVVVDPWALAAVVAGEVALGALIVGVALHLLDGRPLWVRGRPAPRRPGPPAPSGRPARRRG